MKIITGRGRNRKVFELPCAQIVKSSPEKEQILARDLVCDILGVKRDD